MRPSYAEVDLGAIRQNLNHLSERVAPAKIMAVVKANAYGHGVEAVSRVALSAGASYLGVALLEEGIQLRSLGFDVPVLVFGGFFVHEIDQFLEHELELTLFDLPRAISLSQRAQERGQRARVHIKVDTGMGRVGVPWEHAREFAQQVFELEYIDIVGVYTHFASSEEQDPTYSNVQLRRFRDLLTELEQAGIDIPIRHAANSGAVLSLPDSYFDLVRVGLSMYGYYPALALKERVPLRPAMSIKSRVIAVKTVEKDTPISYNQTYMSKARTEIATLPIGYADGYNRLLSNIAEVLIRGTRYPVVGRVCMDQVMLDLGPDSGVRVGDEAVLLGRQGDSEITIYELCEKMQTIPYELTCSITLRIPRVYVH